MDTGYYEYGVVDYNLPRRPNGLPNIGKRRMRVEILHWTPEWTRVRFLEFHADGRAPGTIARVRTENVRGAPVYSKPPPCRLPYVDN